MNSLMNGPLNKIIPKQLPKCIKENKFVIPHEYRTSKGKLEEFLKMLTDTTENGQLSNIWRRAEKNSTNFDLVIAEKARITLSALNYLNTCLGTVSKINDSKMEKNLDLTIKMWDRVPQKDLFQGNYSTCCIGMGDANGKMMPHYILDTAFNMIELVDNKSGNVIGNALCYFVEENGNPAMVIDNIEINNNIKPSGKLCKIIRNKIGEYASNIANDVTGKNNVPVYIGGNHNDVSINDLLKKSEYISLIGDIDTEDIYLDLYNGWVSHDDFYKRVDLYKLK